MTLLSMTCAKIHGATLRLRFMIPRVSRYHFLRKTSPWLQLSDLKTQPIRHDPDADSDEDDADDELFGVAVHSLTIVVFEYFLHSRIILT